ncbi:MAG: pantoate--beta-alanine ligase [Desulfobacterales bacterium]|jgi:pantoate--beta-alanine ligase|nr:pantoate--beta-alanine ligase [Desulfobacterales bacterium]
MKIIQKVKEMQACADRARLESKKIAFVPTMGYLHEGHLSLVRIAREHCDLLVVSIFVNPSQFAPHEDFEAYPRNFQRDFDMTEKEGVDIIFAPEIADLYPANFQTYVSLEKIPMHLCGISRPIFFRGVATVVTKLFNIVKPHTAVFGKKDYQQLLVIRRMVSDLNMDIDIIGGETIREHDGLAMSSRNTYLTKTQRESAISLNKSLKRAQKAVESGITDASRIVRETKEFISSHPETQIDYVAVCDPETLEDIQFINRPALMALAVKVGSTRLIDNMIFNIK